MQTGGLQTPIIVQEPSGVEEVVVRAAAAAKGKHLHRQRAVVEETDSKVEPLVAATGTTSGGGVTEQVVMMPASVINEVEGQEVVEAQVIEMSESTAGDLGYGAEDTTTATVKYNEYLQEQDNDSIVVVMEEVTQEDGTTTMEMPVECRRRVGEGGVATQHDNGVPTSTALSHDLLHALQSEYQKADTEKEMDIETPMMTDDMSEYDGGQSSQTDAQDSRKNK